MSLRTLALVLLVYIALFALQALFVATSLLLGALFGCRPKEAQLGSLRIARLRLAGVPVGIGLFPLLASLTFPGFGVNEDSDSDSWRRLSLVRRLAILTIPWIVPLLIATICLGPARTLASCLRSIPQLLVVWDTTPLVRGFARVAVLEPAWVLVGVLYAKLATFNLLPIPAVAGGRALGELFAAVAPSSEASTRNLRAALTAVGMILVGLYVLVRFGIGMVRAWL